jgi:dTDP-glucose 4,6-dehydratase
MIYFVTGGCGFIGSCFIERVLHGENNALIINLDNLSYSSNKKFNSSIKKKNYIFIRGDICDKKKVRYILNKFSPDYIVNFAAETHVDNSINKSVPFLNTNVMGVYNILEEVRKYFKKLNLKKRSIFKFIQISTDEVYGDSFKKNKPFNEESKYKPSSPYSASKAAADHLVEAWGRTYNIPYNITISSNNFGPRQYKEKIIPKTIFCLKKKKSVPVYGKGNQLRDWIYVFDNVNAIISIIKKGKKNEKYNICSGKLKTNIFLVKKLCSLYDKIKNQKNSEKLIKFVTDRPGHDFSYNISNKKLKKIFFQNISSDFEIKLFSTVKSYL